MRGPVAGMGMGMGVASSRAIRSSPYALFTAGEQGIWLDPSDLRTVFQDSAGTVPGVVGQPVGLIRDKSGRGNDASQPVAGSRPILARVPPGGRRNLLTYTEDFTNAAWPVAGWSVTPSDTTGPDGVTLDGAKIVSVTGGAVLSRPITATATAHTYRLIAKPGTAALATFLLRNNTTATPLSSITLNGTGSTGGGTRTALANGWYLYTMSAAAGIAVGDTLGLYFGATTGIPIGQYFWLNKAQFEVGTVFTAYQKVLTAYDVTEPGQPDCYCLDFDGVDDFLQTASTNLSGTDKVTVFAGVRKLSDAVAAYIIEHSATLITNAGSFFMTSPQAPASKNFAFKSRGDVNTAGNSASGALAAPYAAVLTGIGDIAGDNATLRVNGAAQAASAVDQGLGNFGNYPTFIGARGGTSGFLRGQLFSLIVRGAACDAATLASMESWVNQKTGAY